MLMTGKGMLSMAECGNIEKVWAPTVIVAEEFMNYVLEHFAKIRVGKNR